MERKGLGFGMNTSKKIFFTIILTTLMVLFQNCGIKQPGIDNMDALSVGFTHTPVPVSCTQCHASKLPAATNTFTRSADGKSNMFSHKSEYGGAKDCAECHAQDSEFVGVTWKNGTYPHIDAAGATITTCNACHTGNPPIGPVGNPAVDHATVGNMQCVDCHKNVGVDWATNGQSVPTQVVYLSPSTVNWTTMTTAHPPTNSKSGMSCTTCHVNYNPSFSIKQFDHDVMPIGTKCVSCHLSGQQVVETNLTRITTKSSTHEGGTNYSKDCSSCHNKTRFPDFVLPTWNSTSSSFTGGKWK